MINIHVPVARRHLFQLQRLPLSKFKATRRDSRPLIRHSASLFRNFFYFFDFALFRFDEFFFSRFREIRIFDFGARSAELHGGKISGTSWPSRQVLRIKRIRPGASFVLLNPRIKALRVGSRQHRLGQLGGAGKTAQQLHAARR
jgi:hypothetical protein